MAQRLLSLRSTDSVPSVDELGGPGLFRSRLAELEPRLLPRAAESVWSSWSTLADGQAFVRLLSQRLGEIDGVVEFADVVDGLVDAALTGAAADVDTLIEALLAAMTPDEVTLRPLRAGHAIRAASDIATAAEGPSRHKVLAHLSSLTDIPAAAAAAFARACGQLLDHADEAWLRELVEQRLLIHREGATQAAVELGYGRLRDAFNAADQGAALAALEDAATMFEQAAAADEQRADADAMAAAARCVLAFAAGDAAKVAAERQRLERRRTELIIWSATPGSRFVAAAGAWLLLAGDLLALERHLAHGSILGLDRPVRAIARAYEGVRLQVLSDDRFGLRSVICPRIVDTLKVGSWLRQGVEALADDHREPMVASGAAALAAAMGAGPRSAGAASAPPLAASPGAGGVARRELPPDPEREILLRQLAAAASAAASVESESLRAAFVDVTRAMAQFVRRSLDNPRRYMKEANDGSTALEVDLQDDLIEFLTYAYPLDGVTGYEPQKVAGGRADIMLVAFNEVLYIECKRELTDATSDALASAYAAQGGAYSAAQHRLGVVAVLDLTAAQSTPPPLFRDCLWIHEQTVPDGGRVLLFVKVPGRRVTPAVLSR